MFLKAGIVKRTELQGDSTEQDKARKDALGNLTIKLNGNLGKRLSEWW